VQGSTEAVRDALSETGVTVFPGWEYYANAGAANTIFDLLPDAVVFVDEPSAIETAQNAWWEKVNARHEQSLVGKLATPEDIFITPEQWSERIAKLPGGDLEQLGLLRIAQAENKIGIAAPAVPDGTLIEFSTQPTPRFHGSIPGMVEEVRKLTASSQRVIFAAPNTGEMERLADMFTEYQVPFPAGNAHTCAWQRNLSR